MKKKIFISLLSVFIFVNNANCADFIIKLASYSNKESLIQKVKLLDHSVQKNIMIVEEDNLYKLFSKSSQSKEKALKLLPTYQKVFIDAYIMVNTYKQILPTEEINITLSLKEESNNSIKTKVEILPTRSLMHPTLKKQPRLSFQDIIRNKTFYLSPQTIRAKSEKILIEAKFTANTVSYKTLIGNVPSMQMNYIIQKNRLYPITNNKISISQFHIIDKIFFEYMIVSRWFKGKKIHKMRYYKKEADARSYIQSISIEDL